MTLNKILIALDFDLDGDPLNNVEKWHYVSVLNRIILAPI